MGQNKSFQLLFLDKETSSESEVLLYAYYAFFSRFRHLSNMGQRLVSSKMLNIYLFCFLQVVCWGSSDFITNDDLVTVNPEQVNRALQCQTTEAWWSHYLLNSLGLLRRRFTSVFSSLSLVITGAVGVWHHLQRIEIQPRAYVTTVGIDWASSSRLYMKELASMMSSSCTSIALSLFTPLVSLT